ncbi:PREDICTED: Fc receptor-like protein 5 [Condylura cristata]|uniref:Fc receptor-like protein 5 n=1 Tax=Condylura cristata TaxID=143302 RepID=UPI00064312E7|nr:PREDICTED: Fc receptor-like protein 5 [Condylura cristata]
MAHSITVSHSDLKDSIQSTKRSSDVDETHPMWLSAPSTVFEIDSVVLKCQRKTEIPLRTVQLYKNEKFLADLGQTSDFHIEQASLKDNGVYKCFTIKAECCSVSSNTAKIEVQGAITKVYIDTQPDLKSIFEGQELVLCCSVNGVPGTISSINWYKSKESEERKMKISSERDFKISVVRSSDAGNYSCVASNGLLSFYSKPVTVTVKVPVSPPVFNLSTPRTPAREGDVVTLHCEAQRGSPPIQYQFFHKGVYLRRQQTTSYLRFAVTAEHSGSYYCTASNGQEARRSRAMSLSVMVPVSPPVFTLSTPRTPAQEGDFVTLRCEAQRGSLPIFYQFYHDNAPLRRSSTLSGGGVSLSFFLGTEHSGNYHCTGDNGFGPQKSESMDLSISVPVSRPVLTIRTPGAQAVEGDLVELHCEAQRGTPPILYTFYQEDKTLGSISAPFSGGASFNLSLTAEHSGNYDCMASNGLGAHRSERMWLSVTVPVSQPVLTLRVPRTQAVVGDTVELHCEAQSGSPPILYWFYHEDISLGSSSAPSGGGTSFSLSLTTEHSGSYTCQASNGFRAQRSEAVTLSITVPVSRPVLTLRDPTQAAVGDVLELHCEAQRGSPPIRYRLYHEDVILGNSSAPAGGRVSFNLSLTTEHSGNYSCEADNGLGAQRSEAVTLYVTGMTGSRVGAVATGVTGGLLSMMGLVVALLLYHWIPRKAGRRPAPDAASSSGSAPQEPTYYNVPGWLELQPVYNNVNPKSSDVIYTEVWTKKKSKPADVHFGGCLGQPAVPATLNTQSPQESTSAHAPCTFHLHTGVPIGMRCRCADAAYGFREDNLREQLTCCKAVAKLGAHAPKRAVLFQTLSMPFTSVILFVHDVREHKLLLQPIL